MAPIKSSVLICSRNGGAKLQRMLQSLRTQNAEIDEIILLDDGSDPPLPNPGGEMKLIRHEQSRGYINSRNELARQARNEFMFFLDDDIVLDDVSAIKTAVEMMAADSMIGAVAYKQRAPDGTVPDVQPVYGGEIRQIANYFGWAHLIRRSAWERVGPFVEFFQYGYEEAEFSLRLLDAGYKVVGNPRLFVIHDVSDGSKNLPRRHFTNMRNVLLTCLLRYPAAQVLPTLKWTMRNVGPYPPASESLWKFRLRLIVAVAAQLPRLLIERKAVSADTTNSYVRLIGSSKNGEKCRDFVGVSFDS
jgi:GT2 family glycosyltransferase